MPVRFQVDPDFYDHPKTTGMSDAAFSLWVRAGSYSAAKLTNGFVSEDVLAYTLRSDVEAADELVRRGLWRRRKGGFQFHQWNDRNLTRDRVEADKKADAERKRKARKAAQQQPSEDEESQHTPGNVRPDSEWIPPDGDSDTDRNPALSVSVSKSVSVSPSYGHFGEGVSPRQRAREEPQPHEIHNGQRPPERCPRHRDHPDPPNCGQCADARRVAEAWDTERTERRKRSAEQLEQAMRDQRYECQHGTPGGAFVRLDGTLHCAMCRRAAQPEAS